MYALCHYLAMRKICKDRLGGKKVYSPGKLLAIAGGFMALGFALQLTYFNTGVRYAAIAVFAAVLFIRRGWIMETVKQVISVRDRKKRG